MNQKIIILVVVLVVIALIGYFGFVAMESNRVVSINTFEECAAAGYPIMESYPEQCRTPDGQNFVRQIPTVQASFDIPIILGSSPADRTATFGDGLILTLVELNDSRCKPGVVCVWAGEITAQFHVVGGNVGQQGREFSIGTTNIRDIAIDTYRFTLNNATETNATVTVSKENSSGSQGSCSISDCGNVTVSDSSGEPYVFPYDQGNMCYKYSKCERQANNKCGWTQTPDMLRCFGVIK